MKHLILILAFIFSCFSLSAQFESGERIRISETFPDDIYIAGGEIFIQAPVHGDAVLAGGTIEVNDSILSDLTVGGGEISISGYVGDDIRVAGGAIEIDSEVMDDLIVFGGQVRIGPNARIHGNVVSYGGELISDGTLLGALRAAGGEIVINGPVHGPASLAAEDLDINDGAEFLSEVKYWTEDGEVDFGNSVKNDRAQYDTSLGWEGNDYADPGTLFGIGILFVIFFLLGGFLILIILEWAFGTWLSKAADQMLGNWSASLGLGLLYVIGVPIAVILSFAIIIGIPIGLFALVFYLFSLFFGNFVAALILAHIWKARKQKSWGIFVTALIALLMSIGLQILTSIPFLGALISLAVLCLTYGAIIMAIRATRTGSSGTDNVELASSTA